MKSKALPILTILLIASFLLAACSALPGGPGAGTPTPLPTVISQTNIVSEGRVVPRDDVELSFATSGQVE